MNQFNNENPWPFRDKELIKLWNSGLKTKGVADRMSLSRNAILGRVKRLRANGIKLEERGDPVQTDALKRGRRMTEREKMDAERNRSRLRTQKRRHERLALGLSEDGVPGRKPKGVADEHVHVPPVPKPRAPEGPIPDAPAEGSLSFLVAVDKSKCLWSYGDLMNKGLVCGLDRVKGSRSYCVAHHAKATERKSGGDQRINYQVKPITGVTM